MEKFFILEQRFEENDVFIDEYTDPSNYGENFAEGISIAESQEPTRLFYKFKKQRKTDYLSGIISFPVISNRFKEILLKFNSSYLEFHPVQLICKKTGEVDTSYSFMNVLNNLPCFDWEQSEFETYPPAPQVVLGVDKLVVKLDAIQDRHLVRMEEIFSLILVSARLKQQIQSAQMTGVEFMKLEDYRRQKWI